MSLASTTCKLMMATTAMALAASASARAKDFDIGSIHISQPWARATPKGASSGAAYMTITNNGTTPDRVSCVSSDASEQCVIHSMTTENGVMKMRPVAGGLEIKPGQTVTLQPSGLHMMLEHLKHPLTAGGTVSAKLKFENAGTIDVQYPIAAIGTAAPGVTQGGGTMMDSHSGNSMQMNSRPGDTMQMNKP